MLTQCGVPHENKMYVLLVDWSQNRQRRHKCSVLLVFSLLFFFLLDLCTLRHVITVCVCAPTYISFTVHTERYCFVMSQETCAGMRIRWGLRDSWTESQNSALWVVLIYLWNHCLCFTEGTRKWVKWFPWTNLWNCHIIRGVFSSFVKTENPQKFHPDQ